MMISKLIFYLGYPLIALALAGSKRTRCIIEHENTVLLLRPIIGNGNWILPGGGIHKNEKPVSAVVREIREETGITISSTQAKFLGDHTIRHNFFEYDAQFYRVELNHLPVLQLQRIEIAEAKWVPYSIVDKIAMNNDEKAILLQL